MTSLSSSSKSSLKRSRNLFATPAPLARYSPTTSSTQSYEGGDAESTSLKITYKASKYYPVVTTTEDDDDAAESSVQKTLQTAREAQSKKSKSAPQTNNTGAIIIVNDTPSSSTASTGLLPGQKSGVAKKSTLTSLAITERKEKNLNIPKPEWHAPWKIKSVISGHLGWVRSIAVDPSNEFFVTGSADRTIKVWDLPKASTASSGALKLTLTGHINAVRGLALSDRHPYMFSCAEDKMVKCWDLECNKVIRQYHGHLSGVFCLKLHPTLDVLITGGRDSVARVWDIRTKNQIHCLAGHEGTVASIQTNATDPQIITGSHDSTVKLWDLAAGKCMTTLTHHKKSIRAITRHPREFSFVTGAADNIKKWQTKDGRFIQNLPGHNAVVNALACNTDGVMVSAADNGSMRFWDYKTGHNFQSTSTIVQPGSLDAECGVFATEFDVTGTRLITAEADKTIKIWKEDEDANEVTDPIDMKEWRRACIRESKGRY